MSNNGEEKTSVQIINVPSADNTALKNSKLKRNNLYSRSAANTRPKNSAKASSYNTLFPEWNDSVLASERWVLKQPFEDFDFAFNTGILKDKAKDWKRTLEFFPLKEEIVVLRELPPPSPDATQPATQVPIKLHRKTFSVAGSSLNTPNISALHPSEDHFDARDSWSKTIMSAFLMVNENQNLFPTDLLLWNLIFPKLKETGSTPLAASGKYAVKLYHCGGWRRVFIDERIPFDSLGNSLFMIVNNHVQPTGSRRELMKGESASRITVTPGQFLMVPGRRELVKQVVEVTPPSLPKQEIWPALLTKAIIKLYSIAHGNLVPENLTSRVSSPTSPKPVLPDFFNQKLELTIDFPMIVHMLTGWLSQCIPFSHYTHISDLWDFVKDNIFSPHLEEHKERAMLIGVSIVTVDDSTISESRKKELEDIGLDPEVVYTVKEVREWKGKKILKLKNASPFLAWKGKYGVTDKDSWTIEMERELAFPLREREFGDYFWMALEDFAHYFRYLNVFRNLDVEYPYKTILSSLNESPFSNFQDSAPFLYSEEYTDIFASLTFFNKDVSEFSSYVSGSLEGAVSFHKHHWHAANSSTSLPFVKLHAKRNTSRQLIIPAGKHLTKILLECPPTQGYHLTLWTQNSINLDDYTKTLQKMGLHLIENEGTYKTQEPNAWNIWFRYSLFINEPTVLSAQLILSDESLSNAVRFKIINNDTNEEEPIFLLRNIPRSFTPNESGFTIMAECKSSKKVNSGKWKLRLVGDKGSKAKPAYELVAESLKNVQEFPAIYTPNKYLLLFRKSVKVADRSWVSIQLAADTNIKLEILDNGGKITEVEGKGCCTISSFFLYPTTKKDKRVYIIQGSVKSNNITSTPSLATSGSVMPTLQGKPSLNMPQENTELQTSHSRESPTIRLPWKLKFISSVPLAIKNDTEKEDRQALVRSSWESSQPGRAAKAKRLRDRYLHSRTIVISDSAFSEAGSDHGEQLVILPPSRIDRRSNSPMPRSASVASTASVAPSMADMGQKVKRAPIVIEDREMLTRPTIISVAAAKEKLLQKEQEKEQFLQAKKDAEHRREEEKLLNEQKKNEQRADLERRRKEFTDMQTEESKKRDTFNKKLFYENEMHNDRMAPPDTAQKSASLRVLKKPNTLTSSTRQLVS